MSSNLSIWDEIDAQTKIYNTGAAQVLNIAEFNQIAITSHSTRIEGSTLTMNEAIVLLEKGIPATGKPIIHQNMVLDHHEALKFVIETAQKKTPISLELIQQIEAHVMKRTGKTVQSALGITEESKGDFRKVNVSADGHFFVGFDKVFDLTKKLVDNINLKISTTKTTEDINTLAFSAHFDLVTIHPFTDGNGRTSRLLMNYIQAYHGQPLTIVQAENKAQYIEALQSSRNTQSIEPIVKFLAQQHLKWIMKLQSDYDNAIKNEKQEKKLKDKGKWGIGYSIFY